ncbi:MAG TPA: adenylate/guanylate cyclase domain-containing protein [Nitrospina sp.]|nr:adenylate/guanylate cyclase domain-containing protein [Nitrospina sp.]
MLRNKRQCLFILSLALALTITTLLLTFYSNLFWNRWDYQILDHVYSRSLDDQKNAKLSPKIKFISITDRTYQAFKRNTLDRKFLSELNSALSDLQSGQTIYDIIFAYPSDSNADLEFAKSIADLGNVYLPVSFKLLDQEKPFAWQEGSFFKYLKEFLRKRPQEAGQSTAPYATRALVSLDSFMRASLSAGHINLSSDLDGVFRHYPIVVRVGSSYFPSLALTCFLDSVKIEFQEILIDWGRAIVIPANDKNDLNEDVTIPIDFSGRVFIPYFKFDAEQTERIDASQFLEKYSNEFNRGELANKYTEGRFVFIADVSQGIPDKGKTPIHEKEQPSVLAHAAVLNGLINNSFHEKFSTAGLSLLIIAMGLVLGVFACLRKSIYLYGAGILLLAFVWKFTFYEFSEMKLFPITTFSGIILLNFSGLLFGVLFVANKDQRFVQNAFSKYVPAGVVDQILSKPEVLTLGGEERIMSVLFSDIAGFTTISEKMTPVELVGLLNEYLTAMTNIVLEEGGIIDKFEGDAVMAEFGAPIPTQDHADRAVLTGIKMQRRLKELRNNWLERGLPKIEARVGINTGSMVIGNMGSDQVFDYTVMGDAVNLASRLEGANKLYGTFLMISEYTLEYLTPDRFRVRLLDVIKVKGKSEAVKVYEVYGECSEEINSADLEYYNSYQQGFEAYLNKNFSEAKIKFSHSLSLRPTDLASQLLLDRIRAIDY